VKINNFNDEGREFIQDFFYANHRFGEPPLFLDWIYPLTPKLEDSELLCISKHNFLKLITENATISIKIKFYLSVCIINRLWRQRFRLKIWLSDSCYYLIIQLHILTSKKDANGYSIDLTDNKLEI
jgi:hypothetical protein